MMNSCDGNNESLYDFPRKKVFLEESSFYENSNEEKLMLKIANICSMSIEDARIFLSYGLLNYDPQQIVQKSRLLRFLFSLMSITKDCNIAHHCYHYLRKKDWMPGLIDVVGVLLSWGATPESLRMYSIPTPAVNMLIVNKSDHFPPESRVEKVIHFIIHSKDFEMMDMKLLITILIQCAFDKKFMPHRPMLRMGIENSLDDFSDEIWTDSFISELCKDLKFEEEYLPDAVNICLEVLTKTERGNDLTLCLSFNLIKSTSDHIRTQEKETNENMKEERSHKTWNRKSTLNDLVSLLMDCRNLWSLNLDYIYHIVLLINDMVNRLDGERKDIDTLAKLRTELNLTVGVSPYSSQFCSSNLSFLDLIKRILANWDILIGKHSFYTLVNNVLPINKG